VVVVDIGGEEFHHSLRRFRGRREQPGREQAGGRAMMRVPVMESVIEGLAKRF